MKKLVLAYSGGLDTSYCAVSLSKSYEVHAVSVNTGGFTTEEIKDIESKAFHTRKYYLGIGMWKFRKIRISNHLAQSLCIIFHLQLHKQGS